MGLLLHHLAARKQARPRCPEETNFTLTENRIASEGYKAQSSIGLSRCPETGLEEITPDQSATVYECVRFCCYPSPRTFI